MALESNESAEAGEDLKVPDDLLQKLHQATLRFHEAKQKLESVMGDADYSHQQRFNQAEDELRRAERDMEQITLEVHGSLKTPKEEANDLAREGSRGGE